MAAPVPPSKDIRRSGHHWLKKFDSDGHFGGFIVLQWQPMCQEWCYSDCYATGQKLHGLEHYKYHAPAEIPE